MEEPLEARQSARLVILDPEGRLLLFRYHDEHKAPFWSTAGGELRAGEDFRTAARRELLEETGFEAPIGPFLCEREDVYAVARSTPARWTEQYFLVEYDGAQTPGREGWTEEEQETIQGWRWWRLQDMVGSQEVFLPSWLPQLLARTLGDRSEALHFSFVETFPKR